MAGSLIAAVGDCEEEGCLKGLIISSDDPSLSMLPVRLRLAVDRAGAMGHVSSLSLGFMVMSRYLRIGLAWQGKRHYTYLAESPNQMCANINKKTQREHQN